MGGEWPSRLHAPRAACRHNTACGTSALFSNDHGSFNTANGSGALSSNVGGTNNTGIGAEAMSSNQSGNYDTAIGNRALYKNVIGNDNTASGAGALGSNVNGGENTASGADALLTNYSGSSNTASGTRALRNNIDGHHNTANGVDALFNTGGNGTNVGNFNGSYNVADGYQALYTINTGFQNVGIGAYALLNADGSTNIAIGYQAGVNLKVGNGNIYIASPGGTSENDTTRIGTPGVQTSAFIAGIVGAKGLTDTAEGVIDTKTSQLGVINSSARFKEDIKNMAAYSRRLFGLRPVTYRYKQPYADGAKPVEPGLIAEEVAQVYPDLVAYGTDGQIETVQYHKLAPMLLNELQNQQRRLEAQAAQLDMQTGRNAALEAEIQNLKTSLADARAEVRRWQDALAERLEKLELVSRTSATHAAR
jgi:hypothetical protein